MKIPLVVTTPVRLHRHMEELGGAALGLLVCCSPPVGGEDAVKHQVVAELAFSPDSKTVVYSSGLFTGLQSVP